MNQNEDQTKMMPKLNILDQVPDEIEFGLVSIQTVHKKFISLKNYGDEAIQFCFSDCFFLTNPKNGAIKPKSAINVAFTCYSQLAKIIVAKIGIKLSNGNCKTIKLSAVFKFPYLIIEKDRLDFGSLIVGNSTCLSTKIINPSEVAIDFEIVKSENNYCSQAFICDTSSGNLLPNKSIEVKFRYKPFSSEQLFMQNFIIKYNGSFSSSIECFGKSSNLNVKLNRLWIDFGETKIGSKVTKDFIISNNEPNEISCQIKYTNSVFQIDSPPEVLKGMSRAKVSVTFSPLYTLNYLHPLFVFLGPSDLNVVFCFGVGHELLYKPINIKDSVILFFEEIKNELLKNEINPFGKSEKLSNINSNSNKGKYSSVESKISKMKGMTSICKEISDLKQNSLDSAAVKSKSYELKSVTKNRVFQLMERKVSSWKKQSAEIKSKESENEFQNKTKESLIEKKQNHPVSLFFRMRKPKDNSNPLLNEQDSNYKIISNFDSLFLTDPNNVVRFFHQTDNCHNQYFSCSPSELEIKIKSDRNVSEYFSLLLFKNHTSEKLEFHLHFNNKLFKSIESRFVLDSGEFKELKIFLNENRDLLYYFSVVCLTVNSFYETAQSNLNPKRHNLLPKMNFPEKNGSVDKKKTNESRGKNNNDQKNDLTLSTPRKIETKSSSQTVKRNFYIFSKNIRVFAKGETSNVKSSVFEVSMPQKINMGVAEMNKKLIHIVTIKNESTINGFLEIKKTECSFSFFKRFFIIEAGKECKVLLDFQSDTPGHFTNTFKFKFNNTFSRKLFVEAFILENKLSIENEGFIYFETTLVNVTNQKEIKFFNEGSSIMKSKIKIPEVYKNIVSFDPNFLVLKPRETQIVKCFFTPKRISSYTIDCPVLIKGSNNKKNIKVVGSGSDGEVIFEKKKIDLGVLYLNIPLEKVIYIVNNSKVHLTVKFRIKKSDFEEFRNKIIVNMNPSEVQIGPSSKKEVLLTLEPLQKCSGEIELYIVKTEKERNIKNHPGDSSLMENVDCLGKANENSPNSPKKKLNSFFKKKFLEENSENACDFNKRRDISEPLRQKQIKIPFSIKSQSFRKNQIGQELSKKKKEIIDCEDSFFIRDNESKSKLHNGPNHKIDSSKDFIMDSCHLFFKAEIPRLKILDIKSTKFSTLFLFNQFQINEINELLKTDDTKAYFSRKTSNLNKNLLGENIPNKLSWDFGLICLDLKNKNQIQVCLIIQNVSEIQLEWTFNLLSKNQIWEKKNNDKDSSPKNKNSKEIDEDFGRKESFKIEPM